MNMRRAGAAVLSVLALLLGSLCVVRAREDGPQKSITIGSKKFTESYVLAEIAKQELREAGFQVTHRQGMGGTIILWEALRSGAIDTYPEYTGTISEEILKAKVPISDDAMRSRLSRLGIGMTRDLGFNNTYALVMRQDRAKVLGIHTISDLRSHPNLRAGVSNEFLKRRDGWGPLSRRYGLRMENVRGLEHSLAYTALNVGAIDVTDAYSTDAKIAEYHLVVLKDDLGFFPQYKAVFLYRLGTDPDAVAALQKLHGTFTEGKMTRLNAAAEQSKNYTYAASLYFTGRQRKATQEQQASMTADITRWTLRHLELVGLSLLLAVAFGIPLGIVASRPGWLSHAVLGVTGIIQTVPSLALLALLVPLPFFGIGTTTAVFALFLYSLLPIVRNTATGLQDIPPSIRESAAALGLEPRAQLFKVFLPMASRTILAGIKTSAIINVGTATLAALIGAGGLGEPIISGLNLNDNRTILEGAIPAAILAIIVQVLFDVLDRALIPKGLRLKAESE